jgi:hypothetical protein
MFRFDVDFWMSDATHITLALFVTAIAVFSCIDAYLRRRKVEIEAADSLLETHVAARDRLLADPSISPSLKAFFVKLETRLATRAHAARVIKNLFVAATRGMDIAPAMRGIVEEMKTLEKTNPSFQADLRSFLETGIFAMTLRWPETRGKYVEVTVVVEKEPSAKITGVVANEDQLTMIGTPQPQLAPA